jgi:hypothetical protein
MILRHPPFRRQVAEYLPLLLIVSAHITKTLLVSVGYGFDGFFNKPLVLLCYKVAKFD